MPKADAPEYPRTPEEWRRAIAHGIGLAPEEGEALHQADSFPVDAVLAWMHQEYRKDRGYSPDFLPALVRNIKGFMSWVYGTSPEPYWPGQDPE